MAHFTPTRSVSEETTYLPRLRFGLVSSAAARSIAGALLAGVLVQLPLFSALSRAATTSPLERSGVDDYLLTRVPDGAPLSAADRTPFYQILSAAMHDDPSRHLPGSSASDRPSDPITPLFKGPSTQKGSVFRLLGTASRIKRIEIDDLAIRKTLQIDHYFEVDFVTADSQGNPLVACLTELPPGMPLTGESGHCCERIELTAYFFKLWQYPLKASAADGPLVLQAAPLFIGKSLTWFKPPQKEQTKSSIAVLCFLVLGTIGLAMLLWGAGQVDRDFFERFILPM